MVANKAAFGLVAILSSPFWCSNAASMELSKGIVVQPPPIVSGSDVVGTLPTASELAAQAEALARIPNARVRFGPHNVPKELEGVLGLFRGRDPVRELQVFMDGIRLAMLGTGTESLRYGTTVHDELRSQKHVRVEQFIRGRPVVAAQLILHTDASTGRVVGINGDFLPDRGMPSEPNLSGSDALKLATEVIEREYPGARDVSSVVEPIVAYGFDADRRGHLVWKVELAFTDVTQGAVHELVMIDAASGVLVRHWPLSHNALQRSVYTMNNSEAFSALPGTLIPNGGSGDVDASTAYSLVSEPYSFLLNRFGRDSYDGAGKEIRLSVHYGSQVTNALHLRKDGFSILALGDGNGSTYGSFARDPDILSHEYGHAVNTGVLQNVGFASIEESGSIDEAYADLLSVGSDAHQRGLTGTSWRIGELVYVGPNAVRVLSDPHASPAQFDHRDHYRERYAGSADRGGVHRNLTIPALAFYLMVNGGDHPRPAMRKNSVPAIGLALTQDLFWQALTTRLAPSSSFHDLRAATVSLAGVYGTAFATSVDKAWREVGIENCTPPAPPSSVRLFDERCWGQYTMTWAAVPNAAWYQTQYASSSAFNPSYILSGGDIQGCEFSVSARTYLRVKACNQCGCSTYAVALGYAQYYPTCL